MEGKPTAFPQQASPAAAGPAPVGAAPSPAAPPTHQDMTSIKPGDEVYVQKWRDLQKYKEKLNVYIAQTAGEEKTAFWIVILLLPT